MKFGRLLLIGTVLGTATQTVLAQEIEKKKEFGIWTVNCLRQTTKSGQEDCAIVAGGVSANNPDHWAKVGLTIVGRNSDPQMTIRIPGMKEIGDGISVGFDGRQYGRVFLRECEFLSRACETTFNVDERLRSKLGTSEALTVEYKFAKDQSTLLEFDLKGMIDALGYLASLVDPVLNASASFQGGATSGSSSCCKKNVRSEPLQFVVERRASPYNYKFSSSERVWEAPLQKCARVPAFKDVAVNVDVMDGAVVSLDFNVENEAELTKWLDQSAPCSQDTVYWIKLKSSAVKEQATAAKEQAATVNPVSLASWTLYQTVSKKASTVGIVPEAGSFTPTLPAYDGLTASGSTMKSYNSLKDPKP
jgi:invasion protein IalB